MSKKNAKSQEKFTIILSEKIFFDPKFEKENYKFWALNTSFWRSKVVDSLSTSALKVLLMLFMGAQEVRRRWMHSNEMVFSRSGIRMAEVLSELERFQILTRHPFLINKQINELINKENQDQEFQLETKKDSQEIFAKHFQKYVLETIGSADTGFVIGNWRKSHDAFLTTKAFDEFCSTIMSRKNFIAGDWDDQISYFKVSLKSEIESRGVK